MKFPARPCFGVVEKTAPGLRYVLSRHDCRVKTTHPSGYCRHHRDSDWTGDHRLLPPDYPTTMTVCAVCKGTGRAARDSVDPCTTCHGVGWVKRNI